ncbi:MAG: hypothetical protein WCL61_03755, partial [bacterium]
MTKVKAEKIVANLIKPQKGESSFVSNDQIVSGKSEKEALRLEIEDPELANDNGGEKEVDPVQYLKEKFSLEKDDVFNLEKLRKEMAETVSGEKPLSEEERLRLRNLVGKRLGVY